MSVIVAHRRQLECAILEALGINPNTVTGFVLTCDIYGVSTITVTRHVVDEIDPSRITECTGTYELKAKEG